MYSIEHAQPKYAVIARSLLQRIRAGELAAGDCLPSEPALAREFQVSRVTVRHALASLIRDGVLETRRGIGHVVRTGEVTRTIGLLFNRPVFGRTNLSTSVSAFPLLLFNAIRQQLHERGCQGRLYLPEVGALEHQFDYAALLDDLQRKRLAGLVALSWYGLEMSEGEALSTSGRDLQRALAHKRLPLAVVTGRDVPHATTSLDYSAIGYAGARHFLQQGVHRIGLITSARNRARPTRQGFRRAMDEAGAPVQEAWIHALDKPREQNGYEAFRALWSQTPRPDAVVIDDDIAGKGAMTAAAIMGATDDATLRIACHYVVGSDLFMPRPFVKLEVDPTRFAHDVVRKVLAKIDDPTHQSPRSWLKPRIVEPRHDPSAPWLSAAAHDMAHEKAHETAHDQV